jgi:2-polyprenyl-3-methyl-5-hydroxy-6-metoxy-1,4-benzoquinol methylase
MELAETRRIASELSGGTSSGSIKDMIVGILRNKHANGTLLDYGAGKGELLALLHKECLFNTLSGVDMFERTDTLPCEINWYSGDLNEDIKINGQFDTVICSEVIEHLENPRRTFRCLSGLTKPGGLLVLTMPNQESIRSYVGLVLGGHFTQFLGSSYPAHITALVRLDLVRLCAEVGFDQPMFQYTNIGGIPKAPWLTWQSMSFGLLKGRLFSDNIAMITRKHA